MIMAKTGATYQPELIELLSAALDEVASMLPLDKRTPAMKVTLASRILSAAALGVRDPIQLRIAALMEIEEIEDENNIYRGYAQLRRLRRRVEKAEASRRAEVGSDGTSVSPFSGLAQPQVITENKALQLLFETLE
jgi:hypothetical protein